MAEMPLEPRRTRRYVPSLYVLIALGLFSPCTIAATEWVYVAKILDDDDKGIIVRKDGNGYQIEKGAGCLSFWRYEGKQVLISSPGLFLGVGSRLLLPEAGQECRIWDSEDLGTWSSLQGGAAESASRQIPTGDKSRNALILQLALRAVGLDVGPPDGVLGPRTLSALRQFQRANGLAENETLDAPTAIRLSEQIRSKYPDNLRAMELALALLNVARGATGTNTGSGSSCEGGHWISSVSGGGEIVVLEDKSVWQVDAIDRVDSGLWLVTEEIVICGGSTMINTDTGDRVTVTRLK